MIRDDETKVALYPLDSGYIEQMRVWRNHPDVRRWCRQWGLINDREQAQWFASMSDDKSMAMYALACGDKIIGACGLTSICWINRRAEFSLYVDPDKRRKGYARAGLTLLLYHGFNDMNLNRIWGETFDGNPAARLFESLGFVKEGTRKEFYFKDGKYIDAHLYSVSRGDLKP